VSTEARQTLENHLAHVIGLDGGRPRCTLDVVDWLCDPANRDLVLAAMGGTQEPPYAERHEWSEWMDAYGGQRLWHFIEGSERD
jgi:hypothetical protein